MSFASVFFVHQSILARLVLAVQTSHSVWLYLQVRSHFRPEFINRIDEFTVFNPLNRQDIKRIVRLQAKRVEERLTAKKMKMRLLEPAIDFLAVCPVCNLPCLID